MMQEYSAWRKRFIKRSNKQVKFNLFVFFIQSPIMVTMIFDATLLGYALFVFALVNTILYLNISRDIGKMIRQL